MAEVLRTADYAQPDEAYAITMTFLRKTTTELTALATAAIPADGANGSGIMIEGPMSYTLSFPYGTQLAVIAAAAGSSIYVTIGSGVAL